MKSLVDTVREKCFPHLFFGYFREKAHHNRPQRRIHRQVRNKVDRHNLKLREKGSCPHCGKPCAPFYECEERRKYKREYALRRYYTLKGRPRPKRRFKKVRLTPIHISSLDFAFGKYGISTATRHDFTPSDGPTAFDQCAANDASSEFPEDQ